MYSRRSFIKASAGITGSMLLNKITHDKWKSGDPVESIVELSGHVWVYASRFPPDWDCSPILEEVFSDFVYAGLKGIELMESNLRHDDVVSRVGELIQQYKIPVTGTSYYADMWDRDQHQQIIEDAELIIERLRDLGGVTFGITVGDARRIKTESELDAQAELLLTIRNLCEKNSIQPNLHNHTFEVKNDLHDLGGTLLRIPDFPLGPDLNWLIRGGVDPVWFIRKYGKQIVYLHIRDQDHNGRWTKTVGEGVTDFPAIAGELQKTGFKGRAAVELAFEEPHDGPVKEEWKKSRKYVKQVFGW